MSTVKHAQSLDQIHNDITGLKLELEIVHNKKNYYKTTDGKEVITKMKIKLF